MWICLLTCSEFTMQKNCVHNNSINLTMSDELNLLILFIYIAERVMNIRILCITNAQKE